MNTPIESLLFYAKFLTGLILVLNSALILCIRLNVKWLRNISAQEPAAAGPKPQGTRTLMGLILAVILINGLAIYGSNRLFSSVYEVTSQFSFTTNEFVQTNSVPN